MQGITGVNEKIRIKATKLHFHATLAHSCNYIILKDVKDIGLIGVLNSSLINWLFKLYSTNSNVNSYEIESLPLNKNFKRLTSLVTQILTAKRAEPAADTTAVEAEIDVLVYKLYGLTYAEVLVVEPGFGLSEEAYAAVAV